MKTNKAARKARKRKVKGLRKELARIERQKIESERTAELLRDIVEELTNLDEEKPADIERLRTAAAASKDSSVDLVLDSLDRVVRAHEADGTFKVRAIQHFSFDKDPAEAERIARSELGPGEIVRSHVLRDITGEGHVSRLYLIGREVFPIRPKGSHRLFDRYRDDILQLTGDLGFPVVVKIDNVTDVFERMFERKRFDVFKDAPRVGPPFEATWFEWATDTYRVGSLVFAIECDAAKREVSITGGAAGLAEMVFKAADRGAEFVLFAFHHIERDGELKGVGAHCIAGDSDGSPMDEPEVFDGLPPASFMPPLLFTLSLMHCKNVETVDNDPPAKLSAAHRKRHGYPLVQFKTLVVDVPGKKTASHTATKRDEDVMPLHICRGHFKTFTPERPLFGRIVGTYWWPQHVRGSKEHGVIVKDYEVRTSPPGAR